LDTNVWWYMQTHAPFAARVASLKPFGLSAVVAAELLRRAIRPEAVQNAREIIDRWRHAMLTPRGDEWLRAAEALRRVRERHHFDPVGLARLQNDALIAVSCGREGWTVVTTDREDFTRIAEVLGHRAPRIQYLDAPA
jgi:predicted nucleic acid-binding protein